MCLGSSSCLRDKWLTIRCFPNSIARWIKFPDPRDHSLKGSIKSWHSLHRVLQMAINTHWCHSLLTSFVFNDEDLKHTFQICILNNSCCHWFSVQGLFKLAYFSLFLFLKNGFLTVNLPLRLFLVRLRQRYHLLASHLLREPGQQGAPEGWNNRRRELTALRGPNLTLCSSVASDKDDLVKNKHNGNKESHPMEMTWSYSSGRKKHEKKMRERIKKKKGTQVWVGMGIV